MPFLPVLQKIVSDGPRLFVAIASLNLFEISPRPQHASLIAMAKGWMTAFPNDSDFWTNHLIGRRVCNLLERFFSGENRVKDAALQVEVDSMLAALVNKPPRSIARGNGRHVSTTTARWIERDTDRVPICKDRVPRQRQPSTGARRI